MPILLPVAASLTRLLASFIRSQAPSAPISHATSAIAILGRLGGRNRLFLLSDSEFEWRKYLPEGLSLPLRFYIGSDIQNSGEDAGESESICVNFPIETMIMFARQILSRPNDLLPSTTTVGAAVVVGPASLSSRKNAFEFLKVCTLCMMDISVSVNSDFIAGLGFPELKSLEFDSMKGNSEQFIHYLRIRLQRYYNLIILV